MGNVSVVSVAAAFATVVVFLVVLELMRRRGVDPVARLADVVMPPRMAAANGNGAAVNGAAVNGAAAAANGATASA